MLLVSWCAQETFVQWVGMCKPRNWKQTPGATCRACTSSSIPDFDTAATGTAPHRCVLEQICNTSCWCLPEPWAAQGICQVPGLATARLWVPQAKGISRMLARRAEQLEIRAEPEWTEWVILANSFLSKNSPLMTGLSFPLLLEKS